jgi:hypothetical protein
MSLPAVIEPVAKAGESVIEPVAKAGESCRTCCLSG